MSVAEAELAAVGWRVEIVAALPSTSDSVIARAEAGEAEGLAILARRQTAGRGRDGRAWRSEAGNLHLSVLLRPTGPAREAPQWSLLAGVALAEAATAAVAAPGGLALKWPNDLLRDGAKAGGILAECTLARAGQGLAWLVLGFGVNLATAPTLPDRATTLLGTAETPEAFARRLLAALDRWRAVQERRGFGPIRAAWEAHGPARGDACTVRHGTGIVSGRFAGLGEDGSLALDTDDGPRRIMAGEVAEREAG